LETIPEKDIAVAALGASAGLAAMLLVFVGFLFARADSMPAEVADEVTRPYRNAAKCGLVPVIVCAIVMMAAFEWLFHPSTGWLRAGWRWGFWIEAIAFVAYALVAVRMIGKS
jgi:hypothetical protein